MRPEIKDDRQLRALTGVPTEKWEILENAFGRALKEEKERVYQEQVARVNVSVKQGVARKANYRQCMTSCFSCFTI